MARQIYRQEAMERLSSPEQLDLLMPVTSQRGWIALFGVALLLLIGMAWAIFGTMETTVEGNGLLMRFDGFEWVSATRVGTVIKTHVTDSDEVKVGDVLLEVAYFDEEGKEVVEEVRSPRNGRVLDVAVIDGVSVAEGTPLVSVESPDRPLQAVVYILARDGYKVEPEMIVKLLPATESGRGASYLPGKVKTAARFPASRAEMMYSLQNEDWVNSFLALGPVLEVVVDLSEDTAAADLQELYSGTPTQAIVTIETHQPIEFLIPGFGKKKSE